jgi:16S rRNA (cytosine967-C5)-methyltransferase
VSISPARAHAAYLVNAVLLHGNSLNGSQASTQAKTVRDPRTLAAAQSLAYGTLRIAGRLRFYLEALSGRPVAELSPAELLGPLLVGLFELETEASPAYAAVNETVALVAHDLPRARGFANAILRNFQRQRETLAKRIDAPPEPRINAHSEARWNFPHWWLKRLQQAYPEQWQDMVTQLNGHQPMTLRINLRRTSLAAYSALLHENGLTCRQTGEVALTLTHPVPVSELPHFSDGWVSVQDLGAQHAASMLDCVDGMRVLDACAAPGGKTAHLLERHDLDLMALDSEAKRLTLVNTTLSRLGLIAKTRTADAGKPATWWDGVAFDRILLDAPCTGSGVVRRHPDGKWLKRAEDMQHLAQEQARLLDALWPLLKPGGKMLYVTCSLFPGENIEQIDSFLARTENAQLEASTLPGSHAKLNVHAIHPGPETDGFFYARLLKT